MSIVLAFLAVLLFALCAADAIAGVLLRSRRMREWWGDWNAIEDRKAFNREAARATAPRSLP